MATTPMTPHKVRLPQQSKPRPKGSATCWANACSRKGTHTSLAELSRPTVLLLNVPSNGAERGLGENLCAVRVYEPNAQDSIPAELGR